MTSMFTILIKWMELLANVARHVVSLFIHFMAIYVTVKNSRVHEDDVYRITLIFLNTSQESGLHR